MNNINRKKKSLFLCWIVKVRELKKACRPIDSKKQTMEKWKGEIETLLCVSKAKRCSSDIIKKVNRMKNLGRRQKKWADKHRAGESGNYDHKNLLQKAISLFLCPFFFSYIHILQKRGIGREEILKKKIVTS